jgi:hypothetical protein
MLRRLLSLSLLVRAAEMAGAFIPLRSVAVSTMHHIRFLGQGGMARSRARNMLARPTLYLDTR